MINTFESILNSIESQLQSLEWITESGHVLHGVLFNRNGNLILNVNPKALKEPIQFERLTYRNAMGGSRVIYPHDLDSAKYIPADLESESWPIEVLLCEDIPPQSIAEIDRLTSYTFDSFLLFKMPEKRREETSYRKLIQKVQNLDTKIGKVSFSLSGEEKLSSYPSKLEKSLDKLTFTIERDTPFNNRDLLMWHARFSQLLTIINKERVIPRAIHRGMANTLIPHLSQEYNKENYAFRGFVDLKSLVDTLSQILVTFVNNYDELGEYIDDLVAYYHDYPLDPPDKIQLLRLFTSLEQCANYAQKKERTLKKKLTSEQRKRELEFNTLTQQIKQNHRISETVKKYLNETAKKFYITSGSQASPKNKIIGLAKLLYSSYELQTSMSQTQYVELSLKMRNIVAHGFYDTTTEKSFYDNRDMLGQDIELCIRAYTLRMLGARPKTVKVHCEPLKARKFNAF